VTRRTETILGLPVRASRWNATITVTPEQAKQILEWQPSQRPVNQREVDRRVSEMKAGTFRLTHQGMACDTDGRLFDGQHRLWACFLSGVPITVVMFFNEPRENFVVTDRGYGRNEAQDAVQEGHYTDRVQANTGVAAARFIWSYDDGQNPVHAGIRKGWSTPIHDRVLAAHPGIPRMVTMTQTRERRRLRLPAAPMAALFTLFDEAEPEKAAMFLHQLLTGQGLNEGDPALALRNWSADPKALQRSMPIESAYRIVRAWNAFVAGKKLERIYGSISPNAKRARVGGLDPFPRIAGYKAPR
jgi:hypothetical protein